MNNLQLRLITGTGYVLLTCLALMWRHESALIFHMLIVGFSAHELLRLISPGLSGVKKVLAVLSVLSVSGFTYINQDSLINAGYFNYIFLFVGILYLAYVIFDAREEPIKQLSSVALSWVYIAIPLGLFFRIGQMEFGTEHLSLIPYDGLPILLVFILIWANDSFAYVVGRLIGRHHLAPSISPKKTVEGFAGGLIACVALAYFAGNLFVDLDSATLAGLGAIISVAANLGDLFESKIKRTLGVKDSGKALPGHGGFLDRFDSVLFAGPAAYAFFSFFSI